MSTMNNDINQSRLYFNAYLSADTAAETGDSTAYTIVFDTETLDNDSVYDHTTGIFTAPVDGDYLLSYNIAYMAIATGAQTFDIVIRCNGLDYGHQTWPTLNKLANFYGANNWTTAKNVAIIPMLATQTASVIVTGIGGAKVDKIAGPVGSNNPSSFYGFLIN